MAETGDQRQNTGADRGRVRLDPIRDEDLPAVGRFLSVHMPPETRPDEWAAAWRRSVASSGELFGPNHGFLLRNHDGIVGVYLAIYSERIIDGRPERFCNLGLWYVQPEYRLHSLRMAKAMIAQEGWHFTDLTAIPGVQRLNQRLGFQFLDTTTAVVPNLPWPSWPGRTVVSSDPALIDATLAGPDRVYYRDHARCAWARHLVLMKDGQYCYVLFRKERRKGLRLFANLLHVSNPELLRRAFRPLARHLLVRHGTLATLAEVRLAGGRLRPSVVLTDHCPKMFKSTSLKAEHIDYLYSELTSAP